MNNIMQRYTRDWEFSFVVLKASHARLMSYYFFIFYCHKGNELFSVTTRLLDLIYLFKTQSQFFCFAFQNNSSDQVCSVSCNSSLCPRPWQQWLPKALLLKPDPWLRPLWWLRPVNWLWFPPREDQPRYDTTPLCWQCLQGAEWTTVTTSSEWRLSALPVVAKQVSVRRQLYTWMLALQKITIVKTGLISLRCQDSFLANLACHVWEEPRKRRRERHEGLQVQS